MQVNPYTSRITGPQQVLTARFEGVAEGALSFAMDQILDGVVVQTWGQRARIRMAGTEIETLSRAPLQVGDQVRLQVRNIDRNQVTLQVIARTTGRLASASRQDLEAIVTQLEQPVSERSVALVRQMIARGLPLDAETLRDLNTFLAQMPSATEEDARAAVFLKSQGIPLRPELLFMAEAFLTDGAAIGTRLGLLQMLAEVLTASITPGAQSEQTRAALNHLATALRELAKRLTLEMPENDSPAARQELAAALERLLGALGTPVERTVAEAAGSEAAADGQEGQAAGSSRGTNAAETPALAQRLAALAENPRVIAEQMLQEMDALLAEIGQDSAAGEPVRQAREAVAALRERVEFQQVANAARDAAPSPQPYLFTIPFREGGQWHDLQIRVMRRPGEARGAAPDYAHVVLDLDLSQLQALTVDLQVFQGRASVRIDSASPEIRDFIEARSGRLQDALQELGLAVEGIRTTVATPADEPPSEAPPNPVVHVDLRT